MYSATKYLEKMEAKLEKIENSSWFGWIFSFSKLVFSWSLDVCRVLPLLKS